MLGDKSDVACEGQFAASSDGVPVDGGIGNLMYAAEELFQPISVFNSPLGHGNVAMVNPLRASALIHRRCSEYGTRIRTSTTEERAISVSYLITWGTEDRATYPAQRSINLSRSFCRSTGMSLLPRQEYAETRTEIAF